MKLGIIVDSSCGLSKQEAEKRGWKYLPLYMTIDGKEYADGVDITPKEYYDMIDVSMDVRTSATPPGIIEEVLKEASEEFDHVIIYPLSEELSSQTNNIKMIAKEFDNIYVISSKGVGYGITKNCEGIEAYAKSTESFDLVIKKADEFGNSQVGFAIPETMEWLVKGGRASSRAASLANMLKIVPIISFKDGKLDKGGKGRVFKKSFLKASKELVHSQGKKDIDYIIFSAGNKDADELKKTIETELGIKITVVDFPPVIGNHIGKGALSLMAIKK